jgi:hypothetical protein
MIYRSKVHLARNAANRPSDDEVDAVLFMGALATHNVMAR